MCEVLRNRGGGWIFALIVQQAISETYVMWYCSSSSWIEEWGDYWSYWGHYVVYLTLLQLLFPKQMEKVPILGKIDFFTLNLIMLTNTMVLWQIPRLHWYLSEKTFTGEFWINSLMHGANLILLVIWKSCSGRRMTHFNLLETTFLPLIYTTVIVTRVAFFGSVMKYYIPIELASVRNTFLIGMMFTTLQLFTRVVMFPILRFFCKPSERAETLDRFMSHMPSVIITSKYQSKSLRKIPSYIERLVDTTELAFLEPAVRMFGGPRQNK